MSDSTMVDNYEMAEKYFTECLKTFFTVSGSYTKKEEPQLHHRYFVRYVLKNVYGLTGKDIQQLEKKHTGHEFEITGINESVNAFSKLDDVKNLDRLEKFTYKFEKPNGSDLRNKISNLMTDYIFKGYSYNDLSRTTNVTVGRVKKLIDNEWTNHTFKQLMNIKRKLD